MRSIRKRAHASLLPLAVLFGLMPVVSAAPPEGEAQARQELRAVLGATPDTAHGAQLFGICTECHGPHGEGKTSGWPPEISGQHRGVIARELVDFRAGRRWYDPMERIAGRHVLGSTQDIADVAAYVASLPPSSDTTPGARLSAQKGTRLYATRCEWCHGAHGEGNDERLVPRVAGQQYEYLLRQLRDAVEARRPNMRAQHLRLLESCSNEELMGLAAYMSRLDRAAGQ
jgi:cytochrome c553